MRGGRRRGRHLEISVTSAITELAIHPSTTRSFWKRAPLCAKAFRKAVDLLVRFALRGHSYAGRLREHSRANRPSCDGAHMENSSTS